MGIQALELKPLKSLFFYGTLCHLPLLKLVIGESRNLDISPAALDDHAVHWVLDQSFPVMIKAKDSLAHGVLVNGLSDTDIARLDFYEGGYDYVLEPVRVRVGEDVRETQVYLTGEGRWPIGALWDLKDWEREWAPTVLVAASEMMESYGRVSAHDVARRYPQILQRASSAVRASSSDSPGRDRAGPKRSDVDIHESRKPYSNYFAIQEMDLSFPRFDGDTSPVVTRAAFVSGDAATVLPYDPVRDRVLVIEQFRFGPYLRGDPSPWSIEPVAGRIDPGETPEDAARREMEEETGLSVSRLFPVGNYYPSPGAMTEYLYSYVGLADLPDNSAGSAGLASEAEDIRGHLLSFDALMEMLATGEAQNGPLILSALWLDRHREEIRQGA